MGWKERSRVDERVLLVGEYLKGKEPMSTLARQFRVRRKTAYKWVARYRDQGPGGLVDRSRAPLLHPRRVDPAAVEAVLVARRNRCHAWWSSSFTRRLMALCWAGRL
jgi:putative transposase